MNIFNFYGPVYGDVIGFQGADDNQSESSDDFVDPGFPSLEPGPVILPPAPVQEEPTRVIKQPDVSYLEPAP